MRVYLPAKFQVSGIILTSFKQGEVILPHPPPPISRRTPKKPTQISVKPLTQKYQCRSLFIHLSLKNLLFLGN